jgi:outer membrane lipoprotein
VRLNSLLICGACWLLGACAGLPQKVKDVPVTDTSYSEAVQDLDHYGETPVRWGGVIVEVENEEDFTLLHILNYPLNYTGRPQVDKNSAGRFVVKSPQFLDPAVYAKDKEITVAGVIEGEIERTIGKKTVRLPLISSTAMYLWPAYRSTPGYGYGYGYGGYGFSPYLGYGFYGRPYWGGMFGPYW